MGGGGGGDRESQGAASTRRSLEKSQDIRCGGFGFKGSKDFGELLIRDHEIGEGAKLRNPRAELWKKSLGCVARGKPPLPSWRRNQKGRGNRSLKRNSSLKIPGGVGNTEKDLYESKRWQGGSKNTRSAIAMRVGLGKERFSSGSRGMKLEFPGTNTGRRVLDSSAKCLALNAPGISH